MDNLGFNNMIVTNDVNIIKHCSSDDGIKYLCDFIALNEGSKNPFDITKDKNSISINLYPKDTKTLDDFYNNDFSINYYSKVIIKTNEIRITSTLIKKDGSHYTNELMRLIVNMHSHIRDKKNKRNYMLILILIIATIISMFFCRWILRRGRYQIGGFTPPEDIKTKEQIREEKLNKIL